MYTAGAGPYRGRAGEFQYNASLCCPIIGCRWALLQRVVGHSFMSAALGSEKSAHTTTHTNESRSASTTQGETQGPRDRRGKQYSCSQDKEKDSEDKQNPPKNGYPPAPKSMLKLCCMPPFRGSQGRTFTIHGSVFLLLTPGPYERYNFAFPRAPMVQCCQDSLTARGPDAGTSFLPTLIWGCGGKLKSV